MLQLMHKTITSVYNACFYFSSMLTFVSNGQSAVKLNLVAAPLNLSYVQYIKLCKYNAIFTLLQKQYNNHSCHKINRGKYHGD